MLTSHVEVRYGMLRDLAPSAASSAWLAARAISRPPAPDEPCRWMGCQQCKRAAAAAAPWSCRSVAPKTFVSRSRPYGR